MWALLYGELPELLSMLSMGVPDVIILRSFLLGQLDSRLFPPPVGGKGEEGYVSTTSVSLVPQIYLNVASLPFIPTSRATHAASLEPPRDSVM